MDEFAYFPFKTQPFNHQREYLNNYADAEYHALFWEMGSGKSKAIIDNVAYLYDIGVIDVFILIALKGVHTNWPKREIPTHMPDHINYTTYTWSNDRKSVKRKTEWERFKTDDGLKIFVANVEAFSGRGNIPPEILKFLAQIKSTRSTFIACDESTTIKSPDSKRTKNVLKVAAQCDFRRILTGTPITQSPFDAFTQCQFLKPGVLGYKSYYPFTKRYAEFKITHMHGRKPFEEVVCYKNLDELKGKLEKLSSFVQKSECLDLPPKVYQTYEVEPTPEQKKAYNDMCDYMMTQLPAGEMITVENALGKLTKLHQILLGHIIDEDGTTHSIKSNRMGALANVLSETAGKVIIWSQFRKSLADVRDFLGGEFGPESVVEYHGGIGTNDRDIAVDRFQTDPTCRFFVGNPQTAGYGLTLTAAGTEIYFSNPYSLEQRLQSEDRAHRPGQTHDCVTLIDLVVPGTVDEKVIEALRNKVDVAKQITGLLKDWIR